MKKTIATITTLLCLCGMARAQFNLQEMYDFGRGHLTTTLEGFQADKWGSSFFFVDIYHPFSTTAPTSFYAEISRSINLWQQSKIAPLSLHIEWNGGNGIYPYGAGFGGYPINNAWLLGVEWFFHSADFSRTLTLQVLYKSIQNAESNIHLTTQFNQSTIYKSIQNAESNIPLQLTLVWGIHNLLGIQGLSFSGFADLWWENHTWSDAIPAPADATTATVFLAEPQLWYAVGQHFGCPNLNIGGEIEISHNFSGNATGEKGWAIAPCAGLKWLF